MKNYEPIELMRVIVVGMEKQDVLMYAKIGLSVAGIVALIITSYATISTMNKIHDLSEKETHPHLILSYVNYEPTYSNSSNGLYDILLMKAHITVHNTKRSDYPARIVSVKNKILDYDTGKVIVDNNHSSIMGEGDVRIVDAGETKIFRTEIQMNLNSTGNYITQTTIEYKDLKDNARKSINFYNMFELKEETFEINKSRYAAELKNFGKYNERWEQEIYLQIPHPNSFVRKQQ